MPNEKDRRPRRLKTSEPNLYLYSNGKYYYRKGDKEHPLDKFDSLAKAIKAKRLHERKLDETGHAAYELLVNDVSPDYIKEREAEAAGKLHGRRQISPKTLAETKEKFKNYLTPEFGQDRLSDINEVRWNKYVDRAKKMDLFTHRKVFRHFLGWCKQKGYVRYTPDFKIPHWERRRRRVLNGDEIQAIMANSHGNLHLFISFYLFMGMRGASEALRLPWSQVDLDEGIVTIPEHLTKTRRAREIGIEPHVLQLLRERRADQLKSGIKTPWIFPNQKDPKRHASTTGFRTAWLTCLKRAGLTDVTPHDLRATFETHLNKMAGFTDMQKEKFAGASIDVQKRFYVNFGAADLKGLERAVQVPGLDNILRGKFGRREKDGKTKKRKSSGSGASS